MTALRKPDAADHKSGQPAISPEAFDYQADVTAEVVEWLRAKAAKVALADGSTDDEWVMVDGVRSVGP